MASSVIWRSCSLSGAMKFRFITDWLPKAQTGARPLPRFGKAECREADRAIDGNRYNRRAAATGEVGGAFSSFLERRSACAFWGNQDNLTRFEHL